MREKAANFIISECRKEEAMLKKSTKLWILLSVILVVVVLIIGKNKNNLVTSCGLAEAITYDKLTALDIPVNNPENVLARDDEDWDYYQVLVDFNQQDDTISILQEIPLVVIASPVDQLEHNSVTIGQKILIEKVLQGDEGQTGKTVMFYQHSPFRIQAGKINCDGVDMLLEPKRKYVLFLKPSDLNGRWKKNIYYSDPIFFSFLTLDREIPVLEKKESYRFNELNGIEFLSDSERIIEQANKLRRKILEYYSLL